MVTDALTIGIGGDTYIFTNWLGAVQEEVIADYSQPAKWDVTCPMYLGDYGSGIVLTSFAGAVISLQENAKVGINTWISGGSTSGGVLYQAKAIAGLYIGVSHELISGHEALRRFSLYANSLITKQDVKLISTHIRDWASVENPDWKQLVIDFEVEARSDIALALWDRLSDELDDFLTTLGDKLTPDVHHLISITVQWK
jgi:hypothetical protein